MQAEHAICASNLHGQLISGVTAAVDDVERRHRKQHVVMPRQIRDVTIKRNALLRSACASMSVRMNGMYSPLNFKERSCIQ